MSLRKTVVQKFGGTSVGSLERIQNVAKLIAETIPQQKNVVVVSAMSGETNKLVEMAYKLSPTPMLEGYDFLLASGEQVTCALLSIALGELGISAKPLLGLQVGIETDPLFSKARIQMIKTQLIQNCLDQGIVPIIAGFQGVHHKSAIESVITTLGRGGSDTSAVAIAAALKADRCDIFTDVDGVYTADPRHVKNARRIQQLSFSEMMELASLGAKVLHMRSVELAAKFNIPLRVLSTFNPHEGGTLFTQDSLESPVVSAITTDAAETLLSIEMSAAEAVYPAKYFKPLADAGINVDVIVKTPPHVNQRCSVHFTVPQSDGEQALKLLTQFNPQIDQKAVVKLSIVGIGMRTHSGVAAKLFEALEAAQIPMHLITTSEIKVSVLIDQSHVKTALVLVHDLFQLGNVN